MKIVFVTNPPLADLIDRERLKGLGEYREVTEEEYRLQGPGTLADAEIILCGSQLVKKELFDACPKLKLVVIRAVGYNTVDLSCAAARGITVCNNPLYATVPVAQHAAALLLSLTNQIRGFSNEVLRGAWGPAKARSLGAFPMMELRGKTLGVIGFGRIGRETARILAPFGMQVLAHDPYPTEEGRALAEYVPLDDLLAGSDVISLNCPLTPENHHLIDRDKIARMKDGVMIINVSRGKLIDEQALAEALRSGKVRAAGLDVLENEPPADDCPLLSAPNCLITPHVAWSAPESRKRMADCMIDTAEAWMAGRPINVLTAPERT